MNALAIVTVVVGLLILALRGPLLFAPEATRRFYLRIVATHANIRRMSAVLAAVGGLVLWAAWGGAGALAHGMAVFAWFMLGAAVFLFVFPELHRRLANSLLEAFVDTTSLRAIGVVGIGVGALLVYFGFAAA